VLATLLLGFFLAEHINEAKFAVPAVLLHVVAVLTIAAVVRQLAMIGCMDYSVPVVAMQHQLAELRACETFMGQLSWVKDYA
jgi:hypothetical protein